MIESAAEASEEMMEKYLEGGELTIDEIRAGIRTQVINNEIIPMFCGSAFKNKGVQAVLDAFVYYMPSPLDVPAVTGILDDKDESQAERCANDDEPFSALAFKIATDPFVGTLTFFRVYSDLDIIVDRMIREFDVACNVGAPQVAYREAITTLVEHQHKFAKQSGGRGQYGHVYLRIEPQEPGAGYEFVEEIKGGVIPKEYIPAINCLLFLFNSQFKLGVFLLFFN